MSERIKKVLSFLKKNPSFTIGLIIILITLFIAIFADQ